MVSEHDAPDQCDTSIDFPTVRFLQRVNRKALVIGATEDGQSVITGGIQHVSEGMTVQARGQCGAASQAEKLYDKMRKFSHLSTPPFLDARHLSDRGEDSGVAKLDVRCIQ